MSSTIESPDAHAGGLTDSIVDPLRYDGQSDHPLEVAGILNAMMPSGVRVLDVGCGTASVTLIANHGRNNDVVAIEPDEARASVARKRGIDARTGLLQNPLQESLGTFDVVMSSDVLEHTAAPEAFLDILKRSMKDDGILLISVPNVAHWSVRQMIFRGQFDYEDVGIMDATHLRWFTARSLRALFSRNGLVILEMRYTAGTTLPIYGRHLLGRFPRKALWPLIRVAAQMLPTLFGVQLVVKAKKLSL